MLRAQRRLSRPGFRRLRPPVAFCRPGRERCPSRAAPTPGLTPAPRARPSRVSWPLPDAAPACNRRAPRHRAACARATERRSPLPSASVHVLLWVGGPGVIADALFASMPPSLPKPSLSSASAFALTLPSLFSKQCRAWKTEASR